MKKQLLLFILIFCSFLSYSQTVIFQEFFTDTSGISPEWLNIDHDGDGFKWKWRQNNAGDNYAYSESWDSDSEVPLTPDNYLITPQIDLTGLTGSVNLRYVVGAADADYYEDHYKLSISTDTSIASFTTSLLEETTGEDAWFGWPARNIDLTSYIGKKIYLAWEHYDCSDQYRFLLDSIAVTNNPTSALKNPPLVEINVFPNPVNEKLFLTGNFENATAELISADGRILYRSERISKEAYIDVSIMESGLYILRLDSKDGTLFRKISILQ